MGMHQISKVEMRSSFNRKLEKMGEIFLVYVAFEFPLLVLITTFKKNN